MKSADVQAFFAALKAANPEPHTELQYSSVFELLAAVMLSAQATDVSVNKVTRHLFPIANTPQKVLRLGLQALENQIQTIGLFRNKARHLMQTSEILVSRYDGRVPRNRDALESLPGVGRKTASVILNVAYGEPAVAVDTHIFRVANRSSLAPGSTPAAVERGLLAKIPGEYLRDAHHWLLLHGRYTCKARTPMCWKCPVESLCGYKLKVPATR